MVVYTVAICSLKSNEPYCNSFKICPIPIHRYLTWLDIFLTNIDQTHLGARELLESGGIAVARSLLPGTLSAVDKTMEETFMQFSKSEGISNFFLLFLKIICWKKALS